MKKMMALMTIALLLAIAQPLRAEQPADCEQLRAEVQWAYREGMKALSGGALRVNPKISRAFFAGAAVMHSMYLDCREQQQNTKTEQKGRYSDGR